LPREGRAQRVAYPFAFAEHVGEGGEDAVRHTRQHLVDHARHRVLLVQHQRLAEQHAHHAGRKADVAAQAHHHVGLDAAHHLDALPESLEQAQRQKRQRHHALAAHAGKINVLELKPARRHQLAFHAGTACAAQPAQPVHAPAALAQGLGHGQAGEDVPAGPTGHHKSAAFLAHARPPRISSLFS
jgi:hypothetical protein